MRKVSFSRGIPLRFVGFMAGETTEAPCSIDVQVAAAAEEVDGIAVEE